MVRRWWAKLMGWWGRGRSTEPGDLRSRIARCRKCGHEWLRRAGEVRPARCPNPECRTLCWDRERRPNGGEQRSRGSNPAVDRGLDFGA